MSIVHVSFYPSDWLAGTRGLSAEESGVYITLVCRIYEMAGPIERDDERLARLCGCKSKATFVKALDYLIAEGKIIETEDGLTNERCEKEIENTTEKSAKAKAAAQSRWNKKPRKNNVGSNADASSKHMPTTCQSEPEPEPVKNIGHPPDDLFAPSFEDFWERWPLKKQKKREAEKAYSRLSKDSRQKATDQVQTWARNWRTANPTASDIHPTSYLNGHRWEDDFSSRSRPVSQWPRQRSILDQIRAEEAEAAGGGR